MGKGYLIDSNIVIGFFNQSLPESGKRFLYDVFPIISIITFIEVFSSTNAPESERIELQRFTSTAKIYDVNRDIAEQTIELRLKYRTKLPDAIIAATAMYYDLILVTRNISDFKNIKGLEILNPYTI